MFDATTRLLITQAPSLDQLDLDSLPEEMTEAYATIVSLRLSLANDAAPSEDELSMVLDKLKRLANTYESLVVVQPDNPQTRSAAFVAASARHLLHLAESIRRDENLTSYLRADAISSDLSAILLFIIAGYPSDASAVANKVNAETESTIESALINAISGLAKGDLAGIARLSPDVTSSYPESDDLYVIACRVLWNRLYAGVRAVSQMLLGDKPSVDPYGLFSNVRKDAVVQFQPPPEFREKIGAPLEYLDSACELFGGPHHLASLLSIATDRLMQVSAIALSAPMGIDQEEWRHYVRGLATRRPYLWENHWEAIRKGYLIPGHSAAVSFPTGAGKSALAELKIATALLRGQSVVFLVPTHALVSQVISDLRKAFPAHRVLTYLSGGGEYSETDERPSFESPVVAVMTPERCLTEVRFAPESYTSCGLVVFDECHLIHYSENDANSARRSIDATMCLLHVMAAAPGADVLLLSAMMQNPDKLAEWLSGRCGKMCLSIHLPWKPTRQARGCVVYPSNQIGDLYKQLNGAGRAQILRVARARGEKPKPPSKDVVRQLSAEPHGFFCLHQTWNTTDRKDYALLGFGDAVPLSANAWWSLTPNRVEVARSIGVRMAKAGMKTLVFLQNTTHTVSLAREASRELKDSIQSAVPSSRELELIENAAVEMGDAACVYSPFDGLAGCHHALMLPSERLLNEEAFRRRDGIQLIAATNTLAQGMNLPAEAVIIAGDDRFDINSGHARSLEAHELLNAAGRAGRAGYCPQGMVVIIPGSVVDFDEGKNAIHPRWFDLQRQVFSQSDQCVEIEDPINLCLDKIQNAGGNYDPDLTYFVNRVPVDDAGIVDISFLNRSLSAYYADIRGQSAEFKERIQRFSQFKSRVETDMSVPLWLARAANDSGVDPAIVSSLHCALREIGTLPMWTVSDWLIWFCEWLQKHPDWLFGILRPQTISGAFSKLVKLKNSKEPEKATVDEKAALVQALFSVARSWISGATIKQLETGLNSKTRYAERGRKFALRVVPELSYAVGLVTLLHRRCIESNSTDEQMPLTLGVLAACIKEGFDLPEKLALYAAVGGMTRVECHRLYSMLGEHLPVADTFETLSSLKSRMREPLSEFGF
ncbi:DEAD/DEAH box helicase [bacterium]|nr:DEAD/DEAH box helicase [bacterium]